MSLNDSEIDVLLRRYAKVGNSVKSGDHLDADELNAFAARALPAAARSHYLSHLAGCDECRRAVTELAAASGRLEPLAVPASQSVVESWWHKIGAVFAPSRLRYAAFAAILVAVAGIGYTVWRQSNESPRVLIAPVERPSEKGKSPGTLQAESPTESSGAPQQSPAIAKTIPQPTLAPFVDRKLPESTAANPPPPPKPADNLVQNEKASSSSTIGGATVGSANAAAPSYAPAPSVETERADNRSREQRNLGLMNGPQRGELLEKNKAMDDRSRGNDVAKTRDEDRARSETDQPVAKEESKDEEPAARKRSGSKPATLASRSVTVRQEEAKSDKAGPPAEADTRTVGGRKFKRQGNEWVDVKLKPSMLVTSISRGSEDFEKLDSGLRSISQQFSGPFVVVWKGKAYRIQ